MDQVTEAVSVVDRKVRRQYGLMFLVYFGGMLLARVLMRGLGAVASFSSLFFVLGGAFGLLATIADRLVYVYFSHPQDKLSQDVRAVVAQKKYLDVIRLLYKRGNEQKHRSLNNVLFLGVWVALALFLLTSSGSAFSRGLVLGIGLSMVHDLYFDWSDKEYLKERLFWPIKRSVSGEELKAVVFVFYGAFALMSLLGI